MAAITSYIKKHRVENKLRLIKPLIITKAVNNESVAHRLLHCQVQTLDT